MTWKRFIRDFPNVIDPQHRTPPLLRYSAAYFMLFAGIPTVVCVAIAIPVRIIELLLRALGVL